MISNRIEAAILSAGDLALLVASLWVALLLRNLTIPSEQYFLTLLKPFTAIFVISLIVFYVFGLYERQALLSIRVVGEKVLGAQLANVIAAVLLFFLLDTATTPKTILVLYLAISVAVVTLWHFYFAAHSLVRTPRAKAIVIGEGERILELVSEINANNRHPIEIVDQWNPSAEGFVLTKQVNRALGTGASLFVVDTRHETIARELPDLYGVMVQGTAFLDFVSVYEGVFGRVPLEHIDHAWLIERLQREHVYYDYMKRFLDIVIATFGLILTAPIVLGTMLLLKLGGRPALIRQQRIGKHGSRIGILKLRTMLIDDGGDPELRARNKITALGKVLRKTRIDELPQLWNLLVGDISLIGPRPELPTIASVYEDHIPFYHARHAINPGLSGWAQIMDSDPPKGGADIERTKVKLAYDLYYLKHRSVMLDVAMTLKTIRALLAISGS